jgi:hypothetical protein
VTRVPENAIFLSETVHIQSIQFPESDSCISFSKFSVSRRLLKLFYDELCSFSTFFALNFDKKRVKIDGKTFDPATCRSIKNEIIKLMFPSFFFNF